MLLPPSLPLCQSPIKVPIEIHAFAITTSEQSNPHGFNYFSEVYFNLESYKDSKEFNRLVELYCLIVHIMLNQGMFKN